MNDEWIKRSSQCVSNLSNCCFLAWKNFKATTDPIVEQMDWQKLMNVIFWRIKF